MATIKHKLEYWATKFGFGIASLMPARMANSFGRFLGRLFSKLLPKRKQIALDNLKHAFKETKSDVEYNDITNEVFENIGQTFIDLARFNKISHDILKRNVQCDDYSALEKAKEERKGAIIATAHFGHWEMAGAWVVAMGYPIDIVVKVQSNPLVDNLITQLRKKLKFGQIPVRTSSLRDILRSLKSNRFVVLAADQHDPSENLILDFFGRKASIAKGPAVFAKKQNCPIIPAVMRRISYNTYQIIITKGIYPSENLNEEDDVKRMTTEYLTFLENVISEYPGQWMWTHRRWKIKNN